MNIPESIVAIGPMKKITVWLIGIVGKDVIDDYDNVLPIQTFCFIENFFRHVYFNKSNLQNKQENNIFIIRLLSIHILLCKNIKLYFYLDWDPADVIQYINTLAAKCEYSRSNRENLPLPIQMQLSEKPKTFSWFFIAFLESTLTFEHFEQKIGLIAQVFLKLLTLKDVLT